MTDEIDEMERQPAPPTPATEAADATEPPLAADPNRPADSGWREPAWVPPRDRTEGRRPSAAAVVVGLTMIAVGVWSFLDRTLGVTMPRLHWNSLWPVILIVLGAVILLRSFRRKA